MQSKTEIFLDRFKVIETYFVASTDVKSLVQKLKEEIPGFQLDNEEDVMDFFERLQLEVKTLWKDVRLYDLRDKSSRVDLLQELQLRLGHEAGTIDLGEFDYSNFSIGDFSESEYDEELMKRLAFYQKAYLQNLYQFLEQELVELGVDTKQKMDFNLFTRFNWKHDGKVLAALIYKLRLAGWIDNHTNIETARSISRSFYAKINTIKDHKQVTAECKINSYEQWLKNSSNAMMNVEYFEIKENPRKKKN